MARTAVESVRALARLNLDELTDQFQSLCLRELSTRPTKTALFDAGYSAKRVTLKCSFKVIRRCVSRF